jgi:predicted XRE-type DNA-binding protein
MSNERFASVWDAIEDNPEEAEKMEMRSILLMALKNHMASLILAEATGAYPLPEEEREWIDAPAVGKEL